MIIDNVYDLVSFAGIAVRNFFKLSFSKSQNVKNINLFLTIMFVYLL